MENSDDVVSFPLLCLHVDVIEIIAQYLSIHDLSACCATSCKMREFFNHNVIWKGRCDKKLAEYLRITECKVEPGFVSPEVKDSTLSPICEWRMSFMRENHLWNNWRQGKYTKQLINTDVDHLHNQGPYTHLFFSSDYLISRYTDRFEILDVRVDPAARVLQFVPSPGFINECLKIIPINSSFILMYSSCVQVYDIDIVTNHYSLRHVFFLHESKKVTVRPGEENKIFGVGKSDYDINNYCVSGTYIVGMIKGDSTLHIWDFETGLKVHSEMGPWKQNIGVLAIKSSQTNNLIFYIIDPQENPSFVLLAYSLTKRAFLPFKEKHSRPCWYTVYNEFVATYFDSLHVYNYVTSNLLLTIPIIEPPSEITGNNLVFCIGRSLNAFNFCTGLVQPLSTIGNVTSFKVLTDRFVLISRNKCHELWQLSPVKKTLMKFVYPSYMLCVNKMCNRLIYQTNSGSCYICHFW